MKRYMAIDQHGETYHLRTSHPRKELLDMFSRQHCDKMYVDLKDGQTRQDGYVIAGLWLTVLEVRPAFAKEG